jgi:hypothetical protein
MFTCISDNDIQIQIGEDGILSLPSFTQQLDFSSTKTSKRRKTMEEEEILKYSIGYKPYQFCKIDLCPL